MNLMIINSFNVISFFYFVIDSIYFKMLLFCTFLIISLCIFSVRIIETLVSIYNPLFLFQL